MPSRVTIANLEDVADAVATGIAAAPAPSGQAFVAPNITTIKTTVVRPADTNAYAANDAFSNSTTLPLAGTFAGAARVSGGSGKITDAIISMSASAAFQGEIWVFDQNVTATNDNGALSVSDADVLNLVGIIPFNTTDITGANAVSYVTGLDMRFTCVGSQNLKFLVKVIAAFTPASAEVLGICLHVEN